MLEILRIMYIFQFKKNMWEINSNYLFIYGMLHIFFHAVVVIMKSRLVLSGGKKIQLMYFPEHCYLVQWFSVFYCVKYIVDRMLVNIVNTFFLDWLLFAVFNQYYTFKFTSLGSIFTW